MMMNAKNLILASLSVSALLVFAFYSNTINYANALDLFTVTTGDYYGIVDVAYRNANQKIYAISAVNDTIIQINSDTYDIEATASTFCTTPIDILALKSFPYLAVSCGTAGVAFYNVNSPFTKLNQTGATSTYEHLVEWESGRRIYANFFNSDVVKVYNLNCIGVQCPSIDSSSIDLGCATNNSGDMDISQARSELYVTCHGTTDMKFVDLTTSTVVGSLVHGLGTNAWGVSYNPSTDEIGLCDNDSNQMKIIGATTRTVLATITLTGSTGCTDIVANPNADLYYVLSLDNTIKIVSGVTNAVIASLPISAIDIVLAANTSLPSIEFSQALQTGYISHNSDGAQVALNQNFITVFVDPASSIVESEVCIDINGDGNVDVCYDDSNGDGVADSGGALETITNQNPPALAVGRFLCQTGVILECNNGEPSNSDIKANGSGLILFFILLVVLMAIVGSALYGRVKIEFNLMLQIPVIMIAVGLSVAFQWIEALWFYVMIFIIIGFAGLAGTSFLLKRKGGSSD